jgi:sugar phosphate isomerase/epimerase
MRSGVVGLMPSHAREVTSETAERLRTLGFTGVTVVIPDPLTAEREQYVRAGTILRDGGITVAQANPRYEILVHPDQERRTLGIRGLQAACQVAGWLKAETTYVRPGSLNPAGPWTPHPDNTSLKTLMRLVDSLRQAVHAAEDVGIPFAIEGGAVCPLDTPQRVRDVVEAVDSPAMRFNADPVNFVRSLDEVYDTTTLIHHLFDLCGKYVICAHAKDLTFESTLTIRMHECLLGEGQCDQVAYLQRFEQCCPDGFVLIEHLPDEKIPAAKRNLDRAAAMAGLAWRGQT